MRSDRPCVLALVQVERKMADVDLEQLSPSQQEALQQYMQVTDQDTADAVKILERSQWSVQV